MNKALIEEKLGEFPLYYYDFIDPNELEFSDRIRYICQHDCPMYGKSWACPPGWDLCRSVRKSAWGLRIAC